MDVDLKDYAAPQLNLYSPTAAHETSRKQKEWDAIHSRYP